MHEVTVTEARRSWSKLVAMADRGEEILITRRGKPVATLLPSTTFIPPTPEHLLPDMGAKE